MLGVQVNLSDIFVPFIRSFKVQTYTGLPDVGFRGSDDITQASFVYVVKVLEIVT